MPYFRTLVTMTLLGFLHLMQLLVLLDKVGLIPTAKTNDIWVKWLLIFLAMLPIYFLMTRLFRMADIAPLKEEYDFNQSKIYRGNVLLVTYAITSLALTFVLAILRKSLGH